MMELRRYVNLFIVFCSIFFFAMAVIYAFVGTTDQAKMNLALALGLRALSLEEN